MVDKIGTLLENAIAHIEVSEDKERAVAAVAHTAGGGGEGRLPVVIKRPTQRPGKGEHWADYRKRMEDWLAPVQEFIGQVLQVEAIPLLTANALAAEISPDQVAALAELETVDMVELDPRVDVTQMNDVIDDIGLTALRQREPGRDGTGVTVAVLDSGVDTQHPYLRVSNSVSTSGESTDIPGSHGTHCAGSIASQDRFYPGVAPGVTLINVKVLRSDGSGTHTGIARGVDEAIDLGADILSMSLGFNHLPRWSAGGHGWRCRHGHCPLCTSIDNASALDEKLVVVAAANEHERAEALRRFGHGSSFDTELGCPGQAREALTVGAITKRTHQPAGFSSHGPTSYGAVKPDLSAPGVNITSTVPVPRDAKGALIPNPLRSDLFARKSGTSMATPIMAGAAALVVQSFRDANRAWTPDDVKNRLLNDGIAGIAFPPNEVGAGRLDVSNL